VQRAGEPVSWRLPGETEAGSAGTQPGRGITGPTVRRWTAPGPGGTPLGPAGATVLPGVLFDGFGFGRVCRVNTPPPPLAAPAHASAFSRPSNTGVHALENPVRHDADAPGMEATARDGLARQVRRLPGLP